VYFPKLATSTTELKLKAITKDRTELIDRIFSRGGGLLRAEIVHIPIEIDDITP